ncbi:MAG: hypothetical protein Q9192_007373, partial [Flavoplaca navasiana]
QDLTEQEDDVGDPMIAIGGQFTISRDTGESDEDEQSTSETRSDKNSPPQVISMHNRQSQTEPRIHAEIDDRVATIAKSMNDVLAQYTHDPAFGEIFEHLDSPIGLAFKWMPPMDFTPDSKDFEVDDDDLMPRREEPMFEGDIFTPGWVRNYGQRKEGFCGRCTPGTWHNLEDASYEKNLTFMHGIASSGLSLPRPSEIRQIEDSKRMWQAYCEFCRGWRRLRKTDTGWNWFRHCIKEHGSPVSTPSIQFTPAHNNAKVGENQDLLQSDVSTSAQLHQLNQIIKSIRKCGTGRVDWRPDQNPRLAESSDHLGRTPLHYAAENGSSRFIRILFSMLPDRKKVINGKAIQGETSLMLAASQGHQDVVALLIKKQADIHVASVTGKTALDEAIEAGFMQIAGLLLSKMTEEERSEYYLRVANRQVRQTVQGSATGEKVPDLVYKSAKQVDEDKLYRLHNAVVLGEMNAVSFLLSQDSTDIDAYSRSGKKPLMLAALNNHGEVIQLLLKHGADINSTSTKGWTTLMHSVREGNRAVVQQLIDLGADVNHLSPDRWTALAEATYQGHRDITALLLQQGADTESRSAHDYTPLMYASYKGDEGAVKLLLQAGANKDVSTSHDETAVLLAAAGGHIGIVTLLLDAGAKAEPDWARGSNDTSEKGKQQAKEKAVGEPEDRTHARGWTPLMLACQGGHGGIAHILLQNGVNTEVKSPYDKTAWAIASENGWEDMRWTLQVELAMLYG